MSIVKEGMAPCSKCGEKHKIAVYRSVNVAENPELKPLVKNGSLFLWECPHCGQMNLEQYEVLYHDPEKKLMIWLMPSEDFSETQMDAINRHASAMGGYTLRRVVNVGELMEKLLVFDAGLDDVTVELCKYVMKLEVAAKLSEEDAALVKNADFHFYQLADGDDKEITLTYPFKGQMMGLNMGWNVYEDCRNILSRNPQVTPGEGFAHINAGWLGNRIK